MKIKKMTAVILIMMLCMTMMPMVAFGASGSIATDKSDYGAGEEISVTISGVTQSMVEETYACFYLYKAGAAYADYLRHCPLNWPLSDENLSAPLEKGNYELRLYSDAYEESSLLAKATFTVDGGTGTAAPVVETPVVQQPVVEEPVVEEPVVVAPVVTPVVKDSSKVTLNVNIRDFKQDGVLFEGDINAAEGMTTATLGSDTKPVFNLSKWQELYGTSVTQDQLNALFNNKSGVNQSAKKTITLNRDDQGYYVIDSSVDGQGGNADGFFPIDGQLFGNEGNDHNYHFSMELHATFQYKSGDTFEFVGDDDVWAYFNGMLCVDLGGVHSAESATVSIDDLVAQGKINAKPGDYISFDMFYMERHLSESNLYVKTNINFVNFNNSAWATQELFDAYEMNLIPDVLMEENLALPIYRDEFAATAVKLYEAMTKTTVANAKSNPFKDTSDPEVLKAYAMGFVKGTSDTAFSPDAMLTRQEAATMLTRVYKKAKLSGWSIDKDSEFTLNYTKPAAFADDSKIDSWAKDSVYFMVSNGVIQGLGDNKFGPKNITEADKAKNTGNATREASLIISVRAFENLK